MTDLEKGYIDHLVSLHKRDFDNGMTMQGVYNRMRINADAVASSAAVSKLFSVKSDPYNMDELEQRLSNIAHHRDILFVASRFNRLKISIENGEMNPEEVWVSRNKVAFAIENIETDIKQY